MAYKMIFFVEAYIFNVFCGNLKLKYKRNNSQYFVFKFNQ